MDLIYGRCGNAAWLLLVAGLLAIGQADAQLKDVTQLPNVENAGIAKSFQEQAGPGQGSVMMPGSSMFIIKRDPARSIRRGRQIFQRKFTVSQGFGPLTNDGVGDGTDASIAAGLVDSCAACHGRPRGAAGFGGDVVTRPDSRDAPHLFGLGLMEMLADEMTQDLRRIRSEAFAEARRTGTVVTRALVAKGIGFGFISANPNGVNTSRVSGVDPDLRIRPFFAHGGMFSIREFIVGAFNDEMGLETVDPMLAAAVRGERVVTPSGLVLDGSTDDFATPPVSSRFADSDGDGVTNEIPTSVLDHMEFYLMNYFKPALYRQTTRTARGLQLFDQIGCDNCHVRNLTINSDRRVADVETVYDPNRGLFNKLFSTARLLITEQNDGSGFPTLKLPARGQFVVRNFFSDLKRHDLGPAFHERNYDGSMTTHFVTEPLWGVGSTPPYGHDGRSINLREVIMRHGGEAQSVRVAFEQLSEGDESAFLEFLNSLVIFPPDDTASNLSPADPSANGFPQRGHGSIALGTLFNDPSDPE